jgi:hypothetical protein
MKPISARSEHICMRRFWFDKNIHLFLHSTSLASPNRLEINFHFRPFSVIRLRGCSSASFQTGRLLTTIAYPCGTVVSPRKSAVEFFALQLPAPFAHDLEMKHKTVQRALLKFRPYCLNDSDCILTCLDSIPLQLLFDRPSWIRHGAKIGEFGGHSGNTFQISNKTSRDSVPVSQFAPSWTKCQWHSPKSRWPGPQIRS